LTGALSSIIILDKERIEDVMSRLATLLREYYERSSYKSIAALAEAAQAYSPLSESYLKHILLGNRLNPAYDKLMAIAQALEIGPEETNRLLETAGFAALPMGEPAASAHPYLQRLTEAFNQLAQTPGISSESLRMAAHTATLVLDGYRLTHLAATQTDAPAETPAIIGEASAPVVLRSLPVATLTPEEGLIDDLLGENLSRSSDEHPLGLLFESLEAAAQQDRWEIKRRITEALPKLVQLQPDAALSLADRLRNDYHPDYRADIRRRVVEAVPVLYRYRPDAASQLLVYRPQDEVYTAMATVEVLHDLERQGLISATSVQPYFAALRLDDPVQQETIAYLRQLLQEVRTYPDAALASMNANRTHPERIFRICILRVAPRLLKSHPEATLDLIAHFLRRNDDGAPAEHQNLRRPVSKALPEILNLLPDQAQKAPQLVDRIGSILQALAQDPDIHVRRALGDTLDRLASLSADLAVMVLDISIQDQDPYVRQRAWRTLLQLADLYPDRANEYYARLLTPTDADSD
jgi:transcriptional regulator with XRE-family HTH domain